MSGRLVAVLVCATLGGGLLAAGCGGDDSSSMASSTTTPAEAESTSAQPSGGGAAEATDKVEISDFAFVPEAIEVNAGAEVTFTNSDDAAHTATADDSSFDTGDLAQGDTATVTFDKPGEFTYYCRFHPFMKATVEVK